MSAPVARRLLRQMTRNAAPAFVKPVRPQQNQLRAIREAVPIQSHFQSRAMSLSRPVRVALMPDSQEPKPPTNESPGPVATQATELSDEEYHELADKYLEAVYEKAEQLQENREDVEVEYSAGVMSITFPPSGTYVLNKQPPNKQIWLSSPTSGPKRYDWVLLGESMHQKEGSGNGEWVYLRDGTNLTSLLNKELGILADPHAEDMTESKDPTE